MNGIFKKIINGWPYILLSIITIGFFSPFFFKGLVPIPSDIIPGVYYPWHDLKYSQYPNGVPVKNSLPSDVVSLTYPLRSLSIDLIKQKKWPLWNAYILNGTPLLANFQSAAFYPLNVIFLFIKNFATAWSIQVILQPFLASIFTYLFLRSLGLKKLSSIFGAIIWGFGGFVSLWVQYNTVIHTILYLPLILYAIKKIGKQPIYGSLLSLSVLFSITAGNPPMTMIMLLTAGIFAIFEFGLDIKKYLLALFFVVIGLGLSSPILLPGLETSKVSIRDFDMVAQGGNIKFLPFGKIITMIIPDYFGNPSTGNLWSIAGSYDNLSIFIGVIPILFFLGSFGHKTKINSKILIFSWFIFFISLILAIKNPFSAWLGGQKILGLSAMVMTRFTVLTSFAVAIASSVTLDELINNKSKFSNWIKPIILLIGFILFGIALGLGINLYFKHVLPEFPFWSIENYIAGSWVAIRNSAIPLAISFIAVSSLILYFVLPSRIVQKTKVIFFSVLLFGLAYDLHHFFQKYNTFSYQEFLYPETPITTRLKELSGRTSRENDAVIPSNMWLPYKLEFSSGYDTLYSLHYAQFLSILNTGKIQNNLSRYAEIEKFDNQLFDFLGINNIVVTKRIKGVPNENGEIPFPYNDKKFNKIFESGVMAILNNPQAFPKIYPVNSLLIATNSSSLEKLLLSTDLSKTAIFEADPNIEIGNDLPKIHTIEFSDQLISISITATEPSLLISSLSYNKGWKLLIDGKINNILIVNHAFMAFAIPFGTHTITLEYYPDSISKGLWICTFSFIILISSIYILPRCFFRKQKYN